MRIGIDLDETISALPEWFCILSRAVLAAGGEVHVITYRAPNTESQVAAELAAYGVQYTRLHVPTRPVEPPAWKAALASDLHLDLMIEDSPEVLARMPPRTARLWLCDPDVFDLDVCIEAMTQAPPPPSVD